MTNELSTPEQWLEKYGDILYRYGLSRVRDPGVAEELVQETLLAALNAKNSYAGRSTEQTWLIGILKHKILDYFRKRSKDKSQVVADYEADIGQDDYFDRHGNWQENDAAWLKPDQSFEHEQFLSVLHECMGGLSPRMAQLFILSELDGIKSEEICKLMSISTLNNYWVMMSRTRMQLRNCLKKNWLDQ
ncbi:MAG TPA: sigma-70 family RNA polymerase sigma factor [Crenotrichaceae bacterium]|nr:sigma-70 family RNA polymerase sigma factor [Crenotrichaceae bacterium]